jgi:molybdate transport system substrate-binding protein
MDRSIDGQGGRGAKGGGGPYGGRRPTEHGQIGPPPGARRREHMLRIGGWLGAVVGRAEIGVAVRDDTPAPDISTTDAFKQALLAAKSVSFTDPAGGVFVVGLLDRLGVTDAVKKKAVPFNTGREAITAVLKGDAARHRFHHEFVPVKGVKVVGVLPKEIEFVNEYSAYIPATSRP